MSAARLIAVALPVLLAEPAPAAERGSELPTWRRLALPDEIDSASVSVRSRFGTVAGVRAVDLEGAGFALVRSRKIDDGPNTVLHLECFDHTLEHQGSRVLAQGDVVVAPGPHPGTLVLAETGFLGTAGPGISIATCGAEPLLGEAPVASPSGQTMSAMASDRVDIAFLSVLPQGFELGLGTPGAEGRFSTRRARDPGVLGNHVVLVLAADTIVRAHSRSLSALAVATTDRGSLETIRKQELPSLQLALDGRRTSSGEVVLLAQGRSGALHILFDLIAWAEDEAPEPVTVDEAAVRFPRRLPGPAQIWPHADAVAVFWIDESEVPARLRMRRVAADGRHGELAELGPISQSELGASQLILLPGPGNRARLLLALLPQRWEPGVYVDPPVVYESTVSWETVARLSPWLDAEVSSPRTDDPEGAPAIGPRREEANGNR